MADIGKRLCLRMTDEMGFPAIDPSLPVDFLCFVFIMCSTIR